MPILFMLLCMPISIHVTLNLPVLQMWQAIATNVSQGKARSMCMVTTEWRQTCWADDTCAASGVFLAACSDTYLQRVTSFSRQVGGALMFQHWCIALIGGNHSVPFVVKLARQSRAGMVEWRWRMMANWRSFVRSLALFCRRSASWARGLVLCGWDVDGIRNVFLCEQQYILFTNAHWKSQHLSTYLCFQNSW